MRVYLSFFGCSSGRIGGSVRESGSAPYAVRALFGPDPFEPVYEADAVDTFVGRRALATLLRRRLLPHYHEAVCMVYVPNDACTVERRCAVDCLGRSRNLRFSLAPGTLLLFSRFTAPGWQALGKRAAVCGKDLLFLSLFREHSVLHLQFAAIDNANADPAAPAATTRDHPLSSHDPFHQYLMPGLMPAQLTVGSTEVRAGGMSCFSTSNCRCVYAEALRLYYESHGLLPEEWSGRPLAFYDAESEEKVPDGLLPAPSLTVAFRERNREILLQRPFTMRAGEESRQEIPFTDPDDGSAHTVTALRVELEDLRADEFFQTHWNEDLDRLVPPDHVLAVLVCTGENSYATRFHRLDVPFVSGDRSIDLIFRSENGLRRQELGAVPKGYAGELALELFSVTRSDPVQPVRFELEQLEQNE